jgi:hypothetical protein
VHDNAPRFHEVPPAPEVAVDLTDDTSAQWDKLPDVEEAPKKSKKNKDK